MTSNPPRRRHRGALLAGGLLGVVIVAALVVSLVLVLKHRDVRHDERDRADALAAANQFAVAMDDVNGADFDAYVKRIQGLLTTKAKTKNLKGIDALKSVYQKGKVKGTGKVLVAGVSESDPDSATVLVVHDSRVSSTAGTVVHHYRWLVDMAKVGGTWLVDDFTPTSSEPGDQPGGTGSTATPDAGTGSGSGQ